MIAKTTLVAMTAFAILAIPVFAHHPAADTVDEEIYAVIDEMVSDTPHADMVFEDMGGGLTETTITSRVPELEDLVDDGLLTYVSLLDGEVSLVIEFSSDRTVSLSILQDESMIDYDKAGDVVETATLGEIKASYR